MSLLDWVNPAGSAQINKSETNGSDELQGLKQETGSEAETQVE
jgi:hypothetical protein